VSHVIDVPPHHAVVGIDECIHMPPHALDRVRMGRIAHIKETDRVVESLLCVALRFEVTVRRPALTAEHTASDLPHIPQELDADVGVAEQECQKQLISINVGAQRWAP
jgi:hypothetical protein